MLKFNVASLLLERGIDNPAKFLTTGGITYHTATRLLSRRLRQLTFENMEKICLICSCTPNELFAWEKEGLEGVAADHPLHKLIPKPPVPTPIERIKKLPKEKLIKLKELLDGLEKE